MHEIGLLLGTGTCDYEVLRGLHTLINIIMHHYISLGFYTLSREFFSPTYHICIIHI